VGRNFINYASVRDLLLSNSGELAITKQAEKRERTCVEGVEEINKKRIKMTMTKGSADTIYGETGHSFENVRWFSRQGEDIKKEGVR